MKKLTNVCVLVVLIAMTWMGCAGTPSVQSKESSITRYIYIPSGADKSVAEAAEDMAYWLGRAGGGNYLVRKYDAVPDNGIRLVDYKKVNLPNVQLAEMTGNGQAFHLLANNVHDVRITGSGTNSFINGIYNFMHELGFRWYMPGENWTIVPRLPESFQFNKLVKPDFRNRFYFGSGGLTAIPGVDPDDTYSKDYLLWNKRNLWNNVDFPTKGHSGTAFYAENKAVLDQNPSWFCDGKVNRYGWIDVNKRPAVDLFISWAKKQVKPTDRFPSIGVDPADGSGGPNDCLPAGHKTIKTYSDKYFWLANQVAESLTRDQAGTRVQLYAYNNHAAPPGIDIHQNVFPVIIPYAYQNVTSPEGFIDLWTKKLKGREMGIYDYWNITQWSKGIPQFDLYQLPQRIKKWKASKITSVQIEGTYGKGPVGHMMWLASQLLWDADQDFEKLYETFLGDCFGAAAPDIRNMYDRWSKNYVGAIEPSQALYDLNRAASKVKDPVIISRINELKAYVHYLNLYEDHLAKNSGASYEALVNYTLGIHHLRLVHTSALVNLYLPLPKGYTRETDKNVQKQKFSSIRKITDASIQANFNNGLRTAIPEVKMSKVQIDISALKPVPNSKKVASAKYINNTNRYGFVMKESGKLVIKVGSTRESNMYVLNSNNDTLYKKAMKADKESFETFTFNLNKGQYYLLLGENGFTRVEFPSNIVFTTSDNWYDNASYPNLYFYIPRDVDEVVYWDMHGPGLNGKGFWIDPEGNKIQAVKLRDGIYKIPVPEKHKGKAWQFVVGHRSHKMVNIPHIYSLGEFTY